MKVKDLIAQLQRMDDDAEVLVSFSSGDYWGTISADLVRDVSYGFVEKDDYHRCYKVLKEDSYDNEQAKEVVIIG